MTAGTLTSKGEASGPTTRVVLVIVDDLALGVLTQFGQGWLHGSWNTIANPVRSGCWVRSRSVR